MGSIATSDNLDIGASAIMDNGPDPFPQQNQPLKPHGKANTGRCLATQLLDQSIIASAGTYRAWAPNRSVTHSNTVLL